MSFGPFRRAVFVLDSGRCKKWVIMHTVLCASVLIIIMSTCVYVSHLCSRVCLGVSACRPTGKHASAVVFVSCFVDGCSDSGSPQAQGDILCVCVCVIAVNSEANTNLFYSHPLSLSLFTLFYKFLFSLSSNLSHLFSCKHLNASTLVAPRVPF